MKQFKFTVIKFHQYATDIEYGLAVIQCRKCKSRPEPFAMAVIYKDKIIEVYGFFSDDLAAIRYFDLTLEIAGKK